MRTVLGLATLALLCTGATAEDLGLELRAGPALHHLEIADTLNPFRSGRIEDVAVRLLYTPPVDLSLLGSPRIEVGGTFNLLGYEQMLHANLNWHVPVFSTPVFLEAGLGGAYVTGYLHNPPPGYRRLGCNTMFYFEAGIGAELPDGWTATLAGEHESHAWLCGVDNQSLNSLSIQIGHKF